MAKQNQLISFGLDIFELKVIKQVIEQVLEELRMQGANETESVKKYRF